MAHRPDLRHRPAQAGTPLQDAALSRQLFETGRQANDPLLIIAAAKLRKSLEFRETDRAPDTATAGATAASAARLPHLDADEMLDVAATLAVENEVLLGLIDDVRFSTSKGVVDGPLYSISKLRSGGADTYQALPFEGGTYADIYVEGREDADLNLYVFDAQNRLVCSDTDLSDIAYCGWRPQATADFTIKVENQGPSLSTYSLITN
ncbi:MAG: hypothetical protein GKR99_10670 [Rhodobacteraceae bacterium]|nr:hypothetical protein [Paracoccaceae bacterium]